MQKALLIGLAGLIGTIARYAIAELAVKRFGTDFPVGTLIVNVVGCFLAGVLFYLMRDRLPVSETWQAVILIGFLGGFTTFSSFGLQTFALVRDGAVGLAVINIAASNILGFLMVWVGYSLARAI